MVTDKAKRIPSWPHLIEYNEGRKIRAAAAVQMRLGFSIPKTLGAIVAMKKRADT
jgi:hypothetical protein